MLLLYRFWLTSGTGFCMNAFRLPIVNECSKKGRGKGLLKTIVKQVFAAGILVLHQKTVFKMLVNQIVSKDKSRESIYRVR
jgi:hypothetical protein